jgi:hypothetical protein
MNKTKSHNERNPGSAARRPVRNLVRNVAALSLGLACVSSVFALDGAQVPAKENSNTSLPAFPHLVVSGSTGTVGMDAHHNDELVFEDGRFHSKQCAKIGFQKSTFHIERDGQVVRFSAVSVSSNYGTLTWKGSIRDGIVEAHYVWKKERLFWTIEREYWFSGEVDNVRL